MSLRRLPKIVTRKSFARYLKANFDDSVDSFFTAMNQESDRLIRTDLNGARKLTMASVDLFDLLPQLLQAHLYRIHGRYYHLSGNYSKAEEHYAKAVELFTVERDYQSRAKVHKALLDVLMYLSRYDEARKTGQKSANYFKCTGQEIDYAQVLSNMGNLYHRLDQNKHALKYYDRALAIFKKKRNKFATAIVQFNRGNIYSNLNDFTSAERLYKQAEKIYDSLDMELAACQCRYSLAYILFLKGEYSLALKIFQETGRCFERLGDSKCHALTQLDTNEINLHLNLYSEVIADSRQTALAFNNLGMNYERGKALYFEAAGYFAFGDFSRVLRLTDRASCLFAGENNLVWQMMCLFLQAKVDYSEGRYKAAIKKYRTISGHYEKTGDQRRWHDTRLAWLEALIKSQNIRTARVHRNYLESKYRQLAGYQKFIYDFLSGDLLRATGDSNAALKSYRRAIKIARQLQASIFPDEIRRFFWMDKLSVYNRIVELNLEMGRNKYAYDVLIQGRADLNRYFETSGQSVRSTKIPREYEAERIRLKSFLRKAMLPNDGGARNTVQSDEIKLAENRLWKIERAIRSKRRDDQKWQTDDYSSAVDIQGKLMAGEAVIHFLCLDDRFGAFVLQSQRNDYVPLPIKTDDLRRLLARFYFLVNQVGWQVSDNNILSILMAEITEAIWTPLTKHLDGVKKIGLIPDGMISRIPFYAIEDGTGSLVMESVQLFIYNSATTLGQSGLKPDRIENFKKVSIFVASQKMLPGAVREGQAVNKRVKRAQLYQDSQATGAEFLKSLEAKGSIVHLAAHASQSYENSLFSSILLSDGPVFAFDVASRQVRSRLVILSGCQTGDPGLYYDADSFSLAQTFSWAGVEEVVASHWPVSDSFTSLLMDKFYEQMSSGCKTHESLQKAIIEIRKAGASLRDWASFYILRRG